MNAEPMTASEAYPHAMKLLIELGGAIGDKQAIQTVIERTIDANPRDWSLVVTSALAWTFAEHARPDPDWKPALGRHQ